MRVLHQLKIMFRFAVMSVIIAELCPSKYKYYIKSLALLYRMY